MGDVFFAKNQFDFPKRICFSSFSVRECCLFHAYAPLQSWLVSPSIRCCISKMTSLLRTHGCIMFNGVFVHSLVLPFSRRFPHFQWVSCSPFLSRLLWGAIAFTSKHPQSWSSGVGAHFSLKQNSHTSHATGHHTCLSLYKKSITSWWSSQSVPPQQLKDLVKHPEILRESGTVFQQRWVPACVHTPSLRFEEGPGYATQKPGFHQLYPPGFA